MLEVNGYLRSSTAGYLGRSFSVYIDALGPLNQVNARSFGSDYYVVVAPSAEVQLDEVRHGYLHYVLEPLASKHSSVLREKQELLQTALRAPALDPVLKTNFKLFLSECLIRAAELRIVKLPKSVPESDKQKRLDDAAAEGYFLAPYFYEALTKFEAQDAGIRLYYPTLVEKLDVRREEKRAEQITFRSTPGTRQLSELNVVAARLAGIADEVERLLAEGEDCIARQDYAGARLAYRTALERSTSGATSNESRRARALYGLALTATQEKQPEVAKNYFQQALEAAREPQLLAWAHIYLGRLLDMENRRDLAMRHYRQALESGDINSVARQAAQKGLDAPFQKSKGVIE
jgi:tetratricopeptide (TPR) repeat protein